MESCPLFYMCFTFIFELKGAAEMTNVRWSQKAAAMAVGKEAQQRRQSRKLRRLQQQPSGTAAAERRDSADRWQRNRESQLQIPPAQRLPVTSQRSCTTVCHHHHSTLGGTCRESLRRSPPARRHPLLAAISATIQCMRLASFSCHRPASLLGVLQPAATLPPHFRPEMSRK